MVMCYGYIWVLVIYSFKCHNCSQLGHVKKVCKSQDSQEDVLIVEDKLEEKLLLTTSCVTTNESTKD